MQSAALAGTFVALAAEASTELSGEDWVRIALGIVIFGGLILTAYWNMVRGLKPSGGNLGNFVAFNAAAAVLTGAALVVASSRNWTTLLLVAGAALGLGFIFGLLFGYPLSGKPPDAPKPGVPKPGVPKPGAGGDAQSTVSATARTLFQESADSLSKVIAGATLVKAQSLYDIFVKVAGEVTKCAGAICPDPNDFTYGAALLLYFLVLGFLSGLLLPHFYGLIESVPGSGGGGDPGGSTPVEPGQGGQADAQKK